MQKCENYFTNIISELDPEDALFFKLVLEEKIKKSTKNEFDEGLLERSFPNPLKIKDGFNSVEALIINLKDKSINKQRCWEELDAAFNQEKYAKLYLFCRYISEKAELNKNEADKLLIYCNNCEQHFKDLL